MLCTDSLSVVALPYNAGAGEGAQRTRGKRCALCRLTGLACASEARLRGVPLCLLGCLPLLQNALVPLCITTLRHRLVTNDLDLGSVS